MYSGFLDSFWGATDFFSVMMQRFYFPKVAKNEVHGVIKKSQLAFLSTIVFVCLFRYFTLYSVFIFVSCPEISL